MKSEMAKVDSAPPAMYAAAGSVASDLSDANMYPVKLPSEITVMLLVINSPWQAARARTVFLVLSEPMPTTEMQVPRTATRVDNKRRRICSQAEVYAVNALRGGSPR